MKNLNTLLLVVLGFVLGFLLGAKSFKIERERDIISPAQSSKEADAFPDDSQSMAVINSELIQDLVLLREFKEETSPARAAVERRVVERSLMLIAAVRDKTSTNLAEVPGLRGAARYFENRPVEYPEKPEAGEFLTESLAEVRSEMRRRSHER